ncbi:type I-E CRISPR-associated protein Cas6/Cse3/CasE [Marinospirillum alkaliphilum]|uniref:CRISPR system Cascade subunit CasE n=1 Tax=Marinospirillum alkaliphilum DSM 21637 TaxID=1122209 RepID=A0A1K1WA98_9GAMM|nr:type I-E CRISPR-associated protein Cas6/Cse3/CasE [Marinospirillum alkaliphilum]SFX34278.1 CRISPR system Cascade subunit CasE [Marinospirillum alkaliphilum DSM 21637]
MYLSKINLKAEPEAREKLVSLVHGGIYASHQLLWQLFTTEPQRHFLFRQEQDDGYKVGKGEPFFYVLSKQAPSDDEGFFDIQTKPFHPVLKPGDRLGFTLRVNPTICRQGKRHDVLMDARISWLAQQTAALGSTPVTSQRALKESLLDKATDMHLESWRSLILASDHRDALETCEGRKATLDLVLKVVADQAVKAWWISRLPRLGLAVGAEDVFQCTGYLQHGLTRKSEAARFSSVDLTGQVTVEDPQMFIKEWSAGIGRAKAFGCGLMLIRRI